MHVKIIKKFAFLTAVLCLFLVSCTPSKKYLMKKNLTGFSETEKVRILILRTDYRVVVSSKTRMRIRNQRTGDVVFDGVNKQFRITPDMVVDPLIIESWNSFIHVNNRPYRSLIQVHNIMGKLNVINTLKIDEYLCSVVPSEIPASWPEEALMAQAIASRTYTYYHLLNKNQKNIFDLDCSTNFQVYRGVISEKESTTIAVKKTTGDVLMYKYKPILAYFHSTCGGRTSDDRQVWQGDDKVYLNSVKCNYCRQSPNYSWKVDLSLYAIKNSLKKKYQRTGKISKISFKRINDRVVSVTVIHSNGKIEMTGNEFRLLFPVKTIRSMYFKATQNRNGLTLTGHGWGHGVGLCQWGAKGLAEKGASHRYILNYYYKGARIQEINTGHIARRH